MSIMITNQPAGTSTTLPVFRATAPTFVVNIADTLVSWTPSFDNYGGFNGTDTYTVPVTGYYNVYAELLLNVNAPAGSAYVKILIYQNGSAASQLDWGVSTGQILASLSANDLLMCSAGDTIQIFCSENGLTSGSVAVDGVQVFTINYVSS